MREEPAKPSRAPVYVTIIGFAIAAALIIYALREMPPPQVTIDRAGTDGQPRDVTVVMRDYVFNPTPLVLIEGETVRISVINAGLDTHEMVLGNARVQAAWAAADAAATPPQPLATAPMASVPPEVGGARVLLGSGGQAEVIYRVPSTEELGLACRLPGHAERGMVGKVELRVAEA